MKRIQQLPHALITQIAAGEVIERPASVVKELLENSIDAGSTRIEIDLEQGGGELIRIVDDGHGIEPDDLLLAFASHATSKLREVNDLFQIGTLGFRGEALASIGGVAQVTLQSRPATRSVGAEIDCRGGLLGTPQPWSGMPGTRLEVRHLFFNIPVRKKFLKSTATEVGHVCETVTRLALAYPGLQVVLRHNGKLVHEIPATATIPERVGLFFGREISDHLYPVDFHLGDARLQGWIADPQTDRGNTKYQYLFVNGRWVRDRTLSAGIAEAFRGLIMTGRHAVAFLYVTLPPDQVDVNVHPTKAEVRFRDSQSLFHLVRSGIRRRLSQQNWIPHLQLPVGEVSEETPADRMVPSRIDGEPASVLDLTRLRSRDIEVPPTPTLFGESPRKAAAEYTPAPWEVSPPPSPVTPPPPPEPASSAEPAIPSRVEPEAEATPAPVPPLPAGRPEVPLPRGLLKAIQIHDSYLVIETAEGMLVVDQHALHERILFEQLQRRVREGNLEVQRLLIPESIDLPVEQAAQVLEAREELARLGLEVDGFGGGSVLLCSYPVLLRRSTPTQIFKGVVDYLAGQDRPPAREVLFNHLLATMACKAAVKAGDPLTAEEIGYLMDLRELAEDSHHCPHGRPTSLLLSRQDLDKQFRRI